MNHIKRTFKWKNSFQANLQFLEDIDSIQIEELLQSVQTLEDSLQDLPSQEDLLAEIDQLTEQMKRDLEEYLNES